MYCGAVNECRSETPDAAHQILCFQHFKYQDKVPFMQILNQYYKKLKILIIQIKSLFMPKNILQVVLAII